MVNLIAHWVCNLIFFARRANCSIAHYSNIGYNAIDDDDAQVTFEIRIDRGDACNVKKEYVN